MIEKIVEAKEPVLKESKVSIQDRSEFSKWFVDSETRAKEAIYFKAEEIKKKTLLKFESKGYEMVHELLHSLEEVYELDKRIADNLLWEAYNAVILNSLEDIELYAYNKVESMHFNGEIPL